MMSGHDEVRAVIDHLVDMINTWDPASCAACYSADAIVQDPRYPEPVRGREIVLDAYRYWFQAFPDVRMVATDHIVDGHKIALEWTFEGTHMGEYLGVQGSARRVKALNVSHFWVHDGLITRDLSLFDASTLRMLEDLQKS